VFRVSERNCDKNKISLLKTIKSIELPSTLTSIWFQAFENQIIEWNLILPNSLRTIWGSAFYKNKISWELILPNTLQTIWDNAFYWNNISWTLVIPWWVTTVTNAFECNQINKIVFWSWIVTINDNAFRTYSCWSKKTIKEIELPQTLTSIWSSAFNGQRIEWELILPNTLQTIWDSAFNNNNISWTLVIPWWVTTVTSAFRCNPIEKIIFSEWVTQINDSAFNGYCSPIISSIKEIELPSTLISIWSQAFSQQNIWWSLKLPESLQSVRNNAFSYNHLSSVYIPNAVTELQAWAFNGYVKWYTTSIKENIDYTWANVKPLIRLYTYTFKDTTWNTLWTWYYEYW
jgi:hypothetical protein